MLAKSVFVNTAPALLLLSGGERGDCPAFPGKAYKMEHCSLKQQFWLPKQTLISPFVCTGYLFATELRLNLFRIGKKTNQPKQTPNKPMFIQQTAVSPNS